MFNVEIEGYAFNTHPLRAQNNYHLRYSWTILLGSAHYALTLLYICVTIAIAIVSESFTMYLCFKWGNLQL